MMSLSGMKVIKRPSLVDDVEKQIIEYLVENKFKPGHLLPREIELAESMGVSRSVVREALSRLKMLGILKSSKRKGIEVCHPDILNGLGRVIIPQILDRDTMEDLFELRLILEMGISEILFLRKKESDIEELRRILKREKSSQTRIISIQSEVKFHGKLYEIAGNVMLRRMQMLLWPVFVYLEEKELEKGEKPKKSEVSHQMLVDIIEKGTPEEYQAAIKRHISIHLDRIEKSICDHQ